MNCSTVRNRLLALADPAAVPALVTAHFEQCPACQGWHRLLVQVDAAVAAIPVPASDGRAKQNVLSQFRDEVSVNGKPVRTAAPKPAIKPAAPVTPAPERVPVGDRLARFWPAGVAAAVLLVGIVLWVSMARKGNEEQPMAAVPDPLLEKVIQAKVGLDTATTPPARLKVLDQLAADIHEQAQALALVTPGEMASLAGMYKDVVEGALVEQARLLGADERRTVLPRYIQKLFETEELARQKAADAPVGSDGALQDIARSAGASRTELAKLMRGA
ncbi:MAG TPA: hypothetical protein VKE40_16840 [Gemmataceae bacterium]|nr:hypothetical protein [Gemmataceae bacterium]